MCHVDSTNFRVISDFYLAGILLNAQHLKSIGKILSSTSIKLIFFRRTLNGSLKRVASIDNFNTCVLLNDAPHRGTALVLPLAL